MSKFFFDIYLEFGFTKLNLSAFDQSTGKLEHYKEKEYKFYFNNFKDLNFNELQKFVEENILELEKSIGVFIKDVYLIIETPQSVTIELSVMKNNEGKKIIKQDAMYLVQDAKQQIVKSSPDLGILHILVEKYILDSVEYKFLPVNVKCKNFSINVKFVCFPKALLKNFEELFSKQQIFINKFICSNYVKKFDFDNNQQNICERSKKIVEGINKQEVVSIPKTIKKTGFFEKLFHFFR